MATEIVERSSGFYLVGDDGPDGPFDTAEQARLAEIAASIEFTAVLTADDFVNGEQMNRMGQNHWALTLVRNGYTYQTEYHQGAAHREWAKNINEPGQLHCVKGDGVIVPMRATLFLEALLVKWTKPTKPNVLDVLHCLVMDAQAADCADFDEFCADYGYDNDSRRAEKIFNTCRDTYHQLKRMFDLEELYELFQDY